MSSPRYQLDGRVAVVRFEAPPVNGLGFALRAGLMTAFEATLASDAVDAIVVFGGEACFSGGADLREFGSAEAVREPDLPALIEAFERSAKPVIAAVGALCMGGGVELALGCHFRVFHAAARIALPEVGLGLLPGAGGTQRLPRAVGVDAALSLILSGKPADIGRFEGTPLVDETAPAGELLSAAVAFARRVAAEGRPLRRLRDLPVPGGEHDLFFQFVRNALAGKPDMGPAPLRCVDAVEAAVNQPFEGGLALERQAFWALMDTPESRALRHAFLAERACGKLAGLPAGTVAREIRRVGIVGAGTMGRGIAMCFLDAGLPVTLVDSTAPALAQALAAIRKTYEGAVAKGRLDAAALAARLDLLRTAPDVAALADADLVVEAVFEDMDAKVSVFRRLDEVLRPGAILASNTSTLDLDRIAASTSRPTDVLGLHFFSPANVMKLLEVVRGARSAPDVLLTAMQLARRIGKTAVVSGVCDGFIGNRMVNEYLRIAGLLIDLGASPWQIDRALERWGMAMGPFRMTDMAGNDIGWAIRKRLAVERPELRFSAVADRLCELGRFGQKTGKGWYRYPPGQRHAEPDPEVDRLIEEYRAAQGLSARAVDDAEIVERCIYALVNEGVRILEEGIAQRASDIDVVYLAGYGFPRLRGGPMHYAEEVGLARVVRRMREFAREPGGDAAFWTPAPLLVRLAETRAGFDATGEQQ